MPKTPSQFEDYPIKRWNLGGAISLAGANTTPVYSRPFHLGGRMHLHYCTDIFRAAGSLITAVAIKMVYHYDVTVAAADWITKVDPMSFLGYDTADTSFRDDRYGIVDRQLIEMDAGKNPKTLPATERYSMIYKSGDEGTRLPFARFEVYTKGLPDGDDTVWFWQPGDDGWQEPPDHTGGDPGSGEGDEIDP